MDRERKRGRGREGERERDKAIAPAWRYGSRLPHTPFKMHAHTYDTATHTLVARRTRALIYTTGK